MKSITNIVYLMFLLFLLSACSKNNAGIVKQTYHDLTSHYNGYFNGNEHFNVHLKNAEKSRKENYQEILPIFAYGDIEEIKSQNATLKTSIDKARLSIQTHQEKTTSKNYLANEDNSISNWSDNAFILMGKSYYLQGQIDSAISCFRYVTANFEDGVDARSKEKIKKQKSNKKKKAKDKKLEDKLIELQKKGKDIRPSKKISVHEASYTEALVWLTKSYISNKQYGEADAILTYARANQDFLKNYDPELELSNAFLYLEQENYDAALPFVEKAHSLIKKQKNKARLQFILGQLYEKTGNKTLAAEFYKKSIKANANFEMVFYAKLKLIQMNRGNSSEERETDKLLAKMTKDNKNKPYFDQLFYEKALIAIENDDFDLAKKHLNKSIDVSISNPLQKGISFVELANLYYNEENYTLAQANYDSSLAFIDEKYVSFNLVEKRSLVLTDLIGHLSTITLNDSLLQLSNMSGKELEAYLYKNAVDIIDQEIKIEEKSKQASLSATVVEVSSDKSDKNAWYFYSEASRSSGYKKFKQIWGDVVLEDNWRRSEKSSETISDNNEEESSKKDEYFARIDAQYEAMLAAVPQSEVDKSNLKNEIIESYYNAAILYKLDLENHPKSIEMFETLNTRFPKNKYEAESLYQLYVLHRDANDLTQAEKVKNQLLTNYPSNKFSDYIKNPNKINEIDSKTSSESYYKQTYLLYENKDFDVVINQCNEAKGKFGNLAIMAKFDLLKAMAIGGKQEYEAFVSSLEYVVSNYKSTEEEEKASEILAYLRGEIPSTKGSTNDVNPASKIIDKNAINNTKDLKQIDSKSIEDGGLKIKFGEKEMNLGGKKGANQTEGVGPK